MEGFLVLGEEQRQRDHDQEDNHDLDEPRQAMPAPQANASRQQRLSGPMLVSDWSTACHD